MHVVRILSVVVAALAFGANSAVAALVTWNTTGSLEPGAGTSQVNGCAGGVECKVTFTSSTGEKLVAKAYSTRVVGTSGTSSSITGNWIEAQIALYSSGIGIKNLANTPTTDTNESGTPEHSIDNDQIHDIVVFELPTTGTWDPEAFRLGYIGNSPLNDSDVQAWVGGSGLDANYDFKNICFSSCTNGAQTLAQAGFTALGSGGNGWTDVPVDTSTSFGSTATAPKYLVMAGNLGAGTTSGFNDAFKIKAISANGVKMPVPASIPLLGLGLAVLAFVRVRAVPKAMARVA